MRFRDLDFRLEPARVRDAREVRAWRDLLAHFHGDELQHPVEAGTDFQFVPLLSRQLQQRARLIDRRLLHGELRRRRRGFAGQLLFGNLTADAELFGVHLRLLELQV